jgi:2-iminobutanoate/2-iminopropanoate deaminase
MLLNAINHSDRPVPTGFSHAIEVSGADRMLFISGQVGRRSDGTVPGEIVEQTKVAIANLTAVLEQAGMTFKNVVKLTVFLTNKADFPGLASAWFPLAPSPAAAATAVVVTALADPNYLVEIEAIAVV